MESNDCKANGAIASALLSSHPQYITGIVCVGGVNSPTARKGLQGGDGNREKKAIGQSLKSFDMIIFQDKHLS